jgi:hypothetical protein
LQDAVVADLEQLFQGETLKNSAGEDRRIRVYPQDLPIRAGADIEPDPEPVEEDPEEEQLEDQPTAETEPEDVPEPYVIVRVPGRPRTPASRWRSFWWCASMTRIRDARVSGTRSTSSTPL